MRTATSSPDGLHQVSPQVLSAVSTDGDDDGTLCPIAHSTGLVGDRWSILIARELLMLVAEGSRIEGLLVGPRRRAVTT